ncbi:MAG TPA: Cof-type HAD-IIB family hydrolase [Sphaerochaeta sp.]|jgi:Cof subfamily protein (haloacid dehalogenase superfamily)|nr:Cof-type HAD-IIB family hydrolase [Sphaerochaeta sp.]
MKADDVKAIILDLDGTLLTSRRDISPYTKQILLQLGKEGIAVGFASGRGYSSARIITDPFPPQLPLTLFNGSMVVDKRTDEIIHHLDLDTMIVNELIRRTRGTTLRLHVSTETLVFLDREDIPLYKRIDPITYADCRLLETLSEADYPCIKAMITGEETETTGVAILDELLKEHPRSFAAVSTFKDHIEIMNPRANKRVGIELVSAMNNIPMEAIIAFGDAENDCEMIKAVGWGVAMANASDTLKACADDITASNDEDGVGTYLARLFGL